MIPNEAMSASSSLGTNYLPWMGRMGSKVGGGAWCAKNNDNTQYMQIDLGHVNEIHSLGIHGKEGVSRHPTVESSWVKSFTLSHSVDGMDWTDHAQDGVLKVCVALTCDTKPLAAFKGERIFLEMKRSWNTFTQSASNFCIKT